MGGRGGGGCLRGLGIRRCARARPWPWGMMARAPLVPRTEGQAKGTTVRNAHGVVNALAVMHWKGSGPGGGGPEAVWQVLGRTLPKPRRAGSVMECHGSRQLRSGRGQLGLRLGALEGGLEGGRGVTPGMHWKGEEVPPPSGGRPAYAQPLSP